MLDSDPQHDAPMRNGFHAERTPGIGWGDEGERIRVVHAGEDDARDTIVDLCLEEGAGLDLAERIASRLLDENALPDSSADVNRRTAEMFRAVILAMDGSALDKTPVWRAFRRVIIGDNGRSLEQDAVLCRCSKQNLCHHEKTTTARLAHLTGRPLVEGNEQIEASNENR